MNLLRSVSLLFLASTAVASRAAIVDFEDLAGTGVGSSLATSYGSTVVSGGFRFVSDALVSIGPGGPPLGANYTGSIALLDNTASGTIAMTRVGGGAFSLNGIDLANVYTDGNPQGSTVTFTGILLEGGLVSQSFAVATGEALQSFVFAGFAGVTSVSWEQTPSFHQFDNVVVDQVPGVPGPMAALPFALMALKRRKRA